jgi:arylsulfatase A-like enzyme
MRPSPDVTAPSKPAAWSFLIVLALWLALVAGLIEGGIRLVQAGVFGKIIRSGPEVIWMAPLADLLWIGVPCVFVLLAQAVLRKWDLRTFGALVLFSAASLCLVVMVPGLHKVAAAILALGIGWQLSSRLATSASFDRLIRRTMPVALLIPVLIAGGVFASRWNYERRELARIPAASADHPNVLLIIWDTVREESISLYGYERETTPFLKVLASQGARFNSAFSTSPWTLASHGSIFSGRYPGELKAQLRTPLTDPFPRVAESFSAAGYATGGFIANDAYCTREYGLHRGFQHYEDYKISFGAIVHASQLGRLLMDEGIVRRMLNFYDIPGRKSAHDVNDEFLGWLDAKGGRPFFAFLNMLDAHQPYVPPEPFRARFTRPGEWYWPTSIRTEYKETTPELLRYSRDQYEASIAYQDSALADLIAELRKRKLLENTVVVVTSDHGEHFGEHKRVSHGSSLYPQLTHVPLVMRFPRRIPPNTVVANPVSLRDMPRTLLDLAGVADGARFPGATLARHWERASDSSVAQATILAEMYSQEGKSPYSVLDNGLLYTTWFYGKPELYNFNSDPRARVNLATDSSYAATMARLAALGPPGSGASLSAK